MKNHFLRRMFQFSRWPIFYKAFAGMVILVIISLGIATVVTTSVLRDRLMTQVQARFVTLASEQMNEVVTMLVQQLDFARSVALDGDFVAAAVEASQNMPADPRAWLDLMNVEWQTSPESSELVQDVISTERNALVQKLEQHAQAFLFPVDILVTDRHGAILAATYRPTDFDRSTVPGWEIAYAEGIGQFHIAQPIFDIAIGKEVLMVFAPIYSEEGGKVVGIVQAAFPLGPLREVVDEPLFEFSLGSTMFDENQRIVAGREAQYSADARISPDWFEFSFRRRRDHWSEIQFTNGTPALVAHVLITAVEIANEEYEQAINGLNWTLFIYQPRRLAYRPVRVAVWGHWLLFVVLATVVVGLGIYIVRRIIVPVVQLKTVVEQHAQGDKNIRAWVYAPDEVGVLAEGVNRLLEEKAELVQSVEQRATERARERARRERDLEVTAAVGEVTSATMRVGELVQSVVELVRDRLSLYFVGLFLTNEAQTRAVLQAGTGEAGRALLARGYQVRVGEGDVGACVIQGASHVMTYADRSDETPEIPELPYARSQVVLPLRSRGEVLGVLWVLSYHVDTFDDETVIVLQTIADQVAVAIDSVRLYAERQQAMRQLQHAYRSSSREAWQELLLGRGDMGAGYQARLRETVRLEAAALEIWRPEAQLAWQEGRVVQSVPDKAGEQYLALPVTSREGIIGVIDVSKPTAAGEWKPEEIAQLEALTFQLGVALENARLYEEAQSRAIRERLTSEAASRIRASLSVDAVLQTAAREMREILGLEEAEMRLSVGLESRPSPESQENGYE